MSDEEHGSVGNIFAHYGSSTTAHAPPKMVASKNVFGKIFWLLVFCFGIGMFTYQTVLLFEKYMANEKSTSIDLKFDILPFPAVTICNQNQFQVSKLTDGLDTLVAAFLSSHKDKLKGNPRESSGQTFSGESSGSDSFAGASSAGESSGSVSSGGESSDGESVGSESGSQSEASPAGSESASAVGSESTSTAGSGSTSTTGTDNPSISVADEGTTGTTAVAGSSATSTSVTSEGTTGTTAVAGSSAASESLTSEGTTGTTALEGSSTTSIPVTSSDAATSSDSETTVAANVLPESGTTQAGPPSSPRDRKKRASNHISTFYHTKKDIDLDAENITWFDDAGEKSSENTIRTNLTNYLSQLDEEDKIAMGHRIEDMLQECTFQGYSCSPEDFLLSYNNVYGNCYTYNHGVNATVGNVSSPGSSYGLSLTLYVNQDDYVPILSQQAGVRVLLHRQDVAPLPDASGFDVSTGSKTAITVKYITVERLGYPYSNCTNGDELDLLYPGGYTQPGCRRMCVQEELEKRCGCFNPNYKTINGSVLCLNAEQVECMEEEIYTILSSSTCSTMCPLPCDESLYEATTSVTVWPAKGYLPSLGESLMERGSEFKAMFENPAKIEDNLRSNFVKLEIYYDNLNFERFTEVPSYDGSNLLGDIGGQLGLWVGMSIVSVGEVLELFVWLIRYWAKSMKKRNGTSVASLISNDSMPLEKWAHDSPSKPKVPY